MSLIQHVTAQEGFDNAPDTADLQLGRQLSRTISYDVLNTHDAHGSAQKREPVGADQVSQGKRIGKLKSAGTALGRLSHPTSPGRERKGINS